MLYMRFSYLSIWIDSCLYGLFVVLTDNFGFIVSRKSLQHIEMEAKIKLITQKNKNKRQIKKMFTCKISY